jgi:hypothetical protein
MEKECCPKFNPKKWDGKTFVWNNKLFIKESMHTFFHIPLPSTINKKITNMCNLAESTKKALKKSDEVLLLFRDPSAFKSEIYLSVTGRILSANNVALSGTFFAKAFAGAFKDVPKFIKQMNIELSKKKKVAKDYYVHYAYCPKCAEKYGNNYMIIFAKIK